MIKTIPKLNKYKPTAKIKYLAKIFFIYYYPLQGAKVIKIYQNNELSPVLAVAIASISSLILSNSLSIGKN